MPAMTEGQQVGAASHALLKMVSMSTGTGDPAGARPWRSFRSLHYPSRDLKSHWLSLRAASLKPLDTPAAVSVKKRAAALACHRFVTMEWSVSTGDPVARITS